MKSTAIRLFDVPKNLLGVFRISLDRSVFNREEKCQINLVGRAKWLGWCYEPVLLAKSA